MSRLITTEQRIVKARKLIQQAREIPLPDDMGWGNFTYVAQVRDTLRQAYEMIKFIPKMPGANAEHKAEALKIMEEMKQAEVEILNKRTENEAS
jgi:hypothetical protein